MNILLITPDCPYPPEKSGGIRTIFNLMSANTTHKIDLLYYNEKDTSAESELEKLMLFFFN